MTKEEFNEKCVRRTDKCEAEQWKCICFRKGI